MKGEKYKKIKCCESREPCRSWLALVAAFFSQFMGASSEVFFSVSYVALMEKFNASRAVMGMSMSLGLSAGGVIGVVSSPFIDRYGTRRMILFGTALLVGGFFVSSWSTEIIMFHVFYGCCGGAGWCLVAQIGHTVVQEAFTHNRGLANGISLMGLSAGTMIGPFFIKYFLDQFGVSGTLLLMAGIHAQMFLLAFALPTSRSSYSVSPDMKSTAEICIDISKTTGHISKDFPLDCDDKIESNNSNGIGDIKDTNLSDMKSVFILQSEASKDGIRKTCDYTKEDEYTALDNKSLDQSGIPNETETKSTSKYSCSKKMKFPIQTILFKNSDFIVYIFVRLTWLSCKYGLTNHCVASAISKGIARPQAMYLPSVIGLSTLIFRFVSVFVLNLRCLNKILYFLVGILCTLAAAVLSALATSLWMMVLAMVLIGCNEGISTTSNPVVVVTMLGVEAFTQGFSLVNLTMVPASLMAVPFYGYLADMSGGYFVPFMVASVFASVSVCLVFAILINHCQKTKVTGDNTSN